MNAKEIAKEILVQNNGIAKASNFVDGGITPHKIAKLCGEGYLEKVKFGYYQLRGDLDISEEHLLARLLPEGIVCLESALFHYGYSDFTPRAWSIAVPREIARKKTKFNNLPIKVYYVKENIYEIGKTIGDFNGVKLSVYDRERTICDCFKYRKRLDNEAFNKALKAYVLDEKKDLNKLSEYAKELRVYNKLFELMNCIIGIL